MTLTPMPNQGWGAKAADGDGNCRWGISRLPPVPAVAQAIDESLQAPIRRFLSVGQFLKLAVGSLLTFSRLCTTGALIDFPLCSHCSVVQKYRLDSKLEHLVNQHDNVVAKNFA